MVVVIGLGLAHPRTRLGLRDIVKALDRAAMNGTPLVCAAACVGVVIGVVTLTGVGTALPAILLPLAQDLGIAVIINRPFMNGEYFRRVGQRSVPDWASEFDCRTWAQFSLKYILPHPAITCVLTETTNPAHMAENAEAAFGRMPDRAQRDRMKAVIAEI